MASRCYTYFSCDESDLHLFFPLQHGSTVLVLAHQPQWISSFLLSLRYSYMDCYCYGRRCLRKKMCCSYLLPCNLYLIVSRNDSKHNNLKPSLVRAKQIFLDRMKGMVSSLLGLRQSLPLHPIFVLLGVAV